jgi:hypothetical protein
VPADSDACRIYPAHRTFEEESDGFLLHKINVKTALVQSDRPRSRSPVLDYPAEPPVDHAVSQYVGARHNAITDPYVDEVHPTPPCQLPAHVWARWSLPSRPNRDEVGDCLTALAR